MFLNTCNFSKDKLISEWQAEQSEFIIAKEQFMRDYPQYFEMNMKVPPDSRTPMFIYRDENVSLYMKNNPHVSSVFANLKIDFVVSHT